MKKLVLLLCLCLAVLTGCSKNGVSSVGNDRTVTYDQLGLTYTLPEEWKDLEGSQIVQNSVYSENTFAQIIYSYLTAQDAAAMAEDPTVSVYDHSYPICQIVLSDADQDSLKELFDQYQSAEEVATPQQGYTYYFLSGNVDALATLTSEDLTNYNTLLSGCESLKESIQSQDFDPNALSELNAELNQYITFDTKSIQGMEVDSTILDAYDITMLHFCGSYTFPQFDQFEVLQQVYDSRRTFPVDFNLVTAVIDAPDPDAEKIINDARKNANASYLTIVMDDTLGSWVLNNLSSLPTTIFVDRNGKIIGEPLTGTHTYEEYMDAVYEHIDVLNGVTPEQTTEEDTTAEDASDNQDSSQSTVPVDIQASISDGQEDSAQ